MSGTNERAKTLEATIADFRMFDDTFMSAVFDGKKWFVINQNFEKVSDKEFEDIKLDFERLYRPSSLCRLEQMLSYNQLRIGLSHQTKYLH